MKDQQHTFGTIGGHQFPTFPYQEYGVKGVGRNRYPIISMDKYIDHSLDEQLHIECCKGIALSEQDYKMGMVYGGLPPEEVARFDGHDCYSEMVKDLPADSLHRKAIEEMLDTLPDDKKYSAIYRYAYFAMGAVIPWFFALYLKKSGFFAKTEQNNNWTDAAKNFPLLTRYIETLPFKTIGRVMFFTTYPNAGVAIHRDAIVAEHSDHNMNLFFSSGWRPSFVWDEIKKEKTYLPEGSRSYFFNNRDYHGVDPEPVFRYTLRIDGTFNDELCEELGLEDGKTWKWDYENAGI